MKKIILTMFLFSGLLIAAIPTKENIDKLVSEIKPTRTGVSQTTLSLIHNPFILIKKSVDKKGNVKTVISKKFTNISHGYSRRRASFRLSATLNKSAKINNRWVAINDKINSYTLKKITKKFVVLQKNSAKPITVYLNRKNKKINLLTK